VSFYYSFQFVLCIIDKYLGFVQVGKKTSSNNGSTVKASLEEKL